MERKGVKLVHMYSMYCTYLHMLLPAVRSIYIYPTEVYRYVDLTTFQFANFPQNLLIHLLIFLAQKLSFVMIVKFSAN